MVSPVSEGKRIEKKKKHYHIILPECIECLPRIEFYNYNISLLLVNLLNLVNQIKTM